MLGDFFFFEGPSSALDTVGVSQSTETAETDTLDLGNFWFL